MNYLIKISDVLKVLYVVEKKKKKAVLAVCSYTDSGTSDNQARQYSIKQLSLTCTNLEGWMFLKHLFATSFGLATVLFPAGLV